MDKQLTKKANEALKRMEQERQPRAEQPKGQQRYADFKEHYEGRDAAILLHNGTTVRGRILESRPYFLRVQTDSGVLYINKAYVVFVKVVA